MILMKGASPIKNQKINLRIDFNFIQCIQNLIQVMYDDEIFYKIINTFSIHGLYKQMTSYFETETIRMLTIPDKKLTPIVCTYGGIINIINKIMPMTVGKNKKNI